MEKDTRHHRKTSMRWVYVEPQQMQILNHSARGSGHGSHLRGVRCKEGKNIGFDCLKDPQNAERAPKVDRLSKLFQKVCSRLFPTF